MVHGLVLEIERWRDVHIDLDFVEFLFLKLEHRKFENVVTLQASFYSDLLE